MVREGIALWALALILLVPARTGAQVEDMEGAVAALESEQFLGSLGACFAGASRPDEVTLTVLVSEAGVAQLTQIMPMLLAETSTCMAQAVAGLQLPPSAWGIEITFAVPARELPAPAPAPPPAPAPVQPVGVVYAAPQPVAYQDESWKPLYRSGRKKVVAGGVLVGVGGLLLLASAGWAVMLGETDAGGFQATAAIPLMLCLVGGLGMLIPGAILIGVGKRRMRKANQMRGQGLGLAPLPALVPLRGGGALLLTWRF
jgi:hypothetical protein